MKPHEIPDAEMLDRANLRDPYPQIGRIRASGCPVAHESLTNTYLIVSHDGVDTILRDVSMSRDPHKGNPGTRMRDSFTDGLGVEANMLFLDPPEHTRLRTLVRRSFTPRAIERQRGRVQVLTDGLLDAVADAARFDVMAALARPLPTMVIAEMLGVEPADHERFKRWSDDSVRSFDPFLDEDGKAAAEKARREVHDYVQGVLDARRRQPQDDLISELAQAQEDDDRLTDHEIVVTCRLLLAAGNLTTTDLIGNAVLALLTHPEQREKLAMRPALIDNAIEETLRYDSPVTLTARVPPRDVESHGCPMGKGESVFLSLAGANRDPAVYPDPDRFDIEREDLHHHAFGGGLHFCLGAHLARLEAQIAVATLLSRFPRLELAPDAELRHGAIPGFRGLEALPVVAAEPGI